MSSVGLRSARAKSQLGEDGRLIKSYTHVYLHQSNSLTRPTFADIDSDVGIAPGSPYGDDLNATAGDADIEILPTRPPYCAALVTITWSTGNTVPNEVSTDPSTKRVVWENSVVKQTIFITENRDGTPILNGAKQPFDGGVPATEYYGEAVARVTVDDADYDKSLVMRTAGYLNNAEYLGAPAGTLQVEVRSNERYQGSYHYWDVEYRFSYYAKGWQPRPTNAGFYCFDQTTGKLRPIRTDDVDPDATDRTKVNEPQLLTIGGAVVPIDDRPDGGNIVEVDHHPDMDFDDFGLI